MSNRLKLIREKATRPRRTVPILTDGEVREQIEAVEHELDRLDAEKANSGRRLNTKTAVSPQAVELTAELDRLFAAAAESTLYLVLEGMQHSVYLALVAQHPPRNGEDGKVLPVDAALGVNGDTFGVPLVRACIVGYRETEDGETLPIDQETVDWLLGTTATGTDAVTGERVTVVSPGFATNRQMETLLEVAFALNRKDDAAPLRRRRSPTATSADE